MSKFRLTPYWIPTIASVGIVIGIIIGLLLGRRESTQPSNFNNKQTSLLYLSALLESKYVDSLSADSIYYYGVAGILSHLDPHSVYISLNELQAINETLSGHFYGLGINYFALQDTLYVGGTMPESPAQKSNIVPGDQLIAINNIVLHANSKADSIIKHCIGRHKPEWVSLTIRKPLGEVVKVRLLPEIISRSSISASVMLDAVCGFIAIDNFSETTALAFHEALNELKKQGLQQLIIDVRGNPGGYMDAVAQIADELIGGNDTLFYTRNKMGKEAIMAGQVGLFEKGPLAILIDEESASASEILAGVVQDYDRGRIYGTRSFGKGLVQEQFDLPNGDAIRITTARYYLPSGRFIQRTYNQLTHSDYFEQSTNLVPDTPNSLASYTRRLHRIVRSGRGIEPDVKVEEYKHIEDIPNNPLIRKTVYGLYYRDVKTLPSFSSIYTMQAKAQLPESWKIALQQVHQKMPDSLAIWRSKQKAYTEQLALAEWANICFGSNGQIVFSWPFDAVLREARLGCK